MSSRLRSTAAALAAALTLAACGSSGDASSGGPSSPSAAVRVTRGTIGATAAGAITVNGLSHGTAGARVKIDDQPGGVDDLRPGQVVKVRAVTDDRGVHAAEVEVEHGIEGRVDDRGTDFIQVAGQRIQVDDSTRQGEDIPGLDAVGVGSVVLVSGLPVAPVSGRVDDRGGLRASRVDVSPRNGGDGADDARVDVKGFVSALVPGASFQLRATPDAAGYWAVDASALGSVPGLVDGAYVEVATTVAPGAGTPPVIASLRAASVHVEDRGVNGEVEVEVEGYVTSVSGAIFFVDGVRVDASGATFVLGAFPADLIPGAKVEAEGRSTNGTLVAHKVTFKAGVRLTAPPASFTATDAVVLGRNVQLPSWLDDDLSAPLSTSTRVEFRGSPASDGQGLVAYRLKDDGGGSASRVWVMAVASEKASPSAGQYRYVVFGFTVVPKANATLRLVKDGPAVDPATFHAAVQPGRTVINVRAASQADVNTGTNVISAEELELEGHE